MGSAGLPDQARSLVGVLPMGSARLPGRAPGEPMGSTRLPRLACSER